MKKYIFANWKSHKNSAEAKHWIEQLSIPDDEAIVIIVMPAFTQLSDVRETINTVIEDEKRKRVLLGAQNVSQFPLGSYTGAVAAAQLADLGVTHCLVGHSERRRYFSESHLDVAQKAQQLVEVGITPVICLDVPYIVEQFSVLPSNVVEKSILAYEPLAAIGSGDREDVGTVENVVHQIRSHYGDRPVIYGGSVASENVWEYLTVSDGVLVGTMALDCAHFNELLSVSASSKSSEDTA